MKKELLPGSEKIFRSFRFNSENNFFINGRKYIFLIKQFSEKVKPLTREFSYLEMLLKT